MRVLAALALGLGILGVFYLLARGPRPDSPAQIAARAAADSVTSARLDAFAAGDLERWADAMRSNSLSIGVAASEVTIGRDAAIAEKDWDLAPMFGGRPSQAPGSSARRSVIGASRRGRIAWTGRVLNYDVEGSSERKQLTLRHTAAYLLTRDGEWPVMIDNYSRGYSWQELKEGATSGRFGAPASVGIQTRSGDARKLVKRFRRWTDDLTRVRLDDEVVIIGPVDGEMAVGDSTAKLLLAAMKERLGKMPAQESSVRAWISEGGGAGWVVANVQASPQEWGGAKVPLRVTTVWRSRGEDSWSLVIAHVSVGVSVNAKGPAAVLSALVGA